MPRIPPAIFLPSIGRLVRYRPPAERSAGGVTVRVDTGVYEGGEISLYYDPMIAKLITHARTRQEAIAVQADALDAFDVEGFRHNIPFLAALMQHERWQAGKLSTAFLSEEYPAAFIQSFRTERRRACSPRSPPPSIMCSARESAAFPVSGREPR
jgi:Acetyl/propionyl-CoA carboxylase, alpha subunit